MLVTIASTAAHSTTGRLRVMSAARGKSEGSSAGSSGCATAANVTPATAPAALITALSVTSWRRSWPRLAPRAARRASSRRRVVARASCRPPTFAVAVAKSKPTVVSRRRMAGRTSAVIASIAGVTVTSEAASLPNIATAANPGSGAVRARAVASVVACCGVTPGFRRAIAPKIWIRRTLLAPNTPPTGMGSQARVSRSGKAKSCGMTPITVTGWSSTRTTFPIALSRPPNHSLHNP